MLTLCCNFLLYTFTIQLYCCELPYLICNSQQSKIKYKYIQKYSLYKYLKSLNFVALAAKSLRFVKKLVDKLKYCVIYITMLNVLLSVVPFLVILLLFVGLPCFIIWFWHKINKK